MDIKIINLKHSKCDFRCDRGTPLGNPYIMYLELERDLVCDNYKRYFDTRIKFDFIMQEYLERILDHYKQHNTVTLGCWCAPKRCHCETIKHWLEQQIRK